MMRSKPRATNLSVIWPKKADFNNTMRAAVRTGILGTTIGFSNASSKPRIPLDKGTLLLEVQAGAINPVDYKLPRAAAGPVLGFDVCGKVMVVDPDSDGSFAVGDIVFGNCVGSLADYATVRASEVARAPKGWTATDCAALPTAYLSALQCLRKGKILPETGTSSEASEKSVLVIGASGGCGLAGLQLCRALGVGRIVAICSAKNSDLVLQYGADEVVDYSRVDELGSFFETNQGKFDCVYDAATNSGAGEDYWNKSIGLLKRDVIGEIIGEYTALNGSPGKWIRALAGKQKKHETIIMKEPSGSDLELVVQLMDRIGARPVTNVMAFDERGIAEGFNLLKSRRTKGKIVFDISVVQ